MKIDVGDLHIISVEDIQEKVKKHLLQTGPHEAIHCPHCVKHTETKDYHCVECKQRKGHPYLEKT